MTDEGEDPAGERDDEADTGRDRAEANDAEAHSDADDAPERSNGEIAGDAAEAESDRDRDAEAPAEFDRSAVEDDDGGSFLGNLTSPKKQLGEAASAFRNARAAGGLPRDDEDRVKLVCRRYAERRAVPLDGLGRPACYDEGHPDCEGCLEDVRDGTVETW